MFRAVGGFLNIIHFDQILWDEPSITHDVIHTSALWYVVESKEQVYGGGGEVEAERDGIADFGTKESIKHQSKLLRTDKQNVLI